MFIAYTGCRQISILKPRIVRQYKQARIPANRQLARGRPEHLSHVERSPGAIPDKMPVKSMVEGEEE
ncbi:hypothetical protein PoB_005469200 [Plakobranchus ocellatus]|uniref:Uncharacterized protein n=1 Tax=Plakobranchus ocellatus TaxID=259542 RepID=A0AAV4CA87_9GAST|nr:hypothetical protein PoB_005469200 [Plakobranchus ocellatus]